MDCNTIYCSSATTTDTGVILIPNRTVKNLVNTCTYGLIIACNVEASANLPVYIQTSLGNIPCFCKYLNEIYSSQLKKRVRYSIGYGNGNTNYTEGQFVVFDRICPRSEITTTGEQTTTEPSPSVSGNRKVKDNE